MPIEIPHRFEEKISTNSLERGIVYAAISSFDSWFTNSGMPFFKDYSDHSSKHLSSVLKTADAMIPSSALEIMSSSDITVLILATLLHDSALYLTEPAFYFLIKESDNTLRNIYFDDEDWGTLWEQFMFSVNRWDNEKIADVLGLEFIKNNNVITDPFSRWGNLTEADNKIIGEFIRMHHPRLSHEFALHGIPGVSSVFLKLPPGLNKNQLDIIGLTARSHGLPLRPCLDYLKEKYHKREYQGIHTVYLMSLLRISDYLQIDSDRAPNSVFEYRLMYSRVSQLEWEAHGAVTNITPEHDDPESIEITINPQNVNVFLRLQEWIKGIQDELDMSWAVLGETYGSSNNLKKLILHWRRVRSNIDSLPEFSKSVNYLPKRIRMDVARAELLSILIRPLYGAEPSFGVRELMQNAVDAVKEREYLQQINSNLKSIKLRDQMADVVIELSSFDEDLRCAIFQISDRGLGMSESTLINYFLKAGASYRTSEQWKNSFENLDPSNDISQNRSMVARAGRFGVGALSGFLIGEEIEVETRHINSQEGYKFKMHLSDESIEIHKADNLKVGTRLRIKVTKKVFDQLNKYGALVSRPAEWDWYQLNEPSIIRMRNGYNYSLNQPKRINLSKWRSLETRQPYVVHWSYNKRSEHDNFPLLTCNGSFISDGKNLPKLHREHTNISGFSRFDIKTPFLHITDPDAQLPLDLTRKNLLCKQYGFEKELAESIIEDYFARLLVNISDTFNSENLQNFVLETPFANGHESDFHPELFLSKEGFALPFNKILQTSNFDIKRFLWIEDDESLSLLDQITDWDLVVVNGGNFIEGLNSPFTQSAYLDFEDIKEFRCSLDCPLDQFKKEILDRQEHHFKRNINYKTKEKLDRFGNAIETTYFYETPEMAGSHFPFLSATPPSKGFYSQRNEFVVDYLLKTEWVSNFDIGILNDHWVNLFGEEWIPWNMKDRKKKFPLVFKKLAKYIEFYELNK